MNKYTDEKNVLILIALLKQHGIKNIIISPGSANSSFVASVQNDEYFNAYSCVDERSAAYMACGLASEIEKPVVLSCTGATASRNYIPAMTEAYYRNIQIIAVTSTKPYNRIGDHVDQVIDRTIIQNDICKLSVHLPIVYNKDDEWECNKKINAALLECVRDGGGPVHIDLPTIYSTNLQMDSLPMVRKISRIFSYSDNSQYPMLSGNIAIFVGSHTRWKPELTALVDAFCEKYNAVVLFDQSSNYKGKYGVAFDLISRQKYYTADCYDIDILIHIGHVSASSISHVKSAWRVSLDGEIRDTFKKLEYIFEMPEDMFFERYVSAATDNKKNLVYFNKWQNEYNRLFIKLQAMENDIPFSSLWIAYKIYNKLPHGCVMHFGILNSLRCWNYFQIDNSINAFANTGGFGIDGGLSSLIGASLADKSKLYYGIVGDLAFFYDMNSLGNRHVGNNIRIILVNNGLGGEFKNVMAPNQVAGLGDDADKYIAAAGHYGNKSHKLVKHYAEDLGFEYFGVNSKEEFLRLESYIISSNIYSKPMLFEIFLDSDEDVKAIEIVQSLKRSPNVTAKKIAKNLLGDKNVKKIKKMIGTN